MRLCISLSLILLFYRENSKLEKEIVLPTPTRANIFAVPLEDLMGYDGEKDGIPRVIKDSIQYLRETGMRFRFTAFRVMVNILAGLEEEGLFRRSPNLTLLNQVANAYDRGSGGPVFVGRLGLLYARSRRITGYVQRSKSCRSVDQEVLAGPSDTDFPRGNLCSDTAVSHSDR